MGNGEATRRPWGWRALGLALIGGLVGWIVAFAGLLMFLQGMRRVSGARLPDESDLMLVAPGRSGAWGPPLAWSSGWSGSW